MSDTNPANDYATGIATIDRVEADAIPNEAITLDDGIVHFEYDFDWLRDDFVVLAYSGETPEGAPRVVHATFNDREAMIAWTLALVDGDNAPATVAELEEVLSDSAADYGELEALGYGVWAHGFVRRQIRLERQARAASGPQYTKRVVVGSRDGNPLTIDVPSHFRD